MADKPIPGKHRVRREQNMETGAVSEWEHVKGDDKSTDMLMSIYETIIQTLAYEAGGSYILTRERFEGALEGIQRWGPNLVPEVGLSRDFIMIRLVDAETDEVFGEGKA